MNRSFAILAITAALWPPFAAANDTIDVLKGGRALKLEYSDGKTSVVRFSNDGTYTLDGILRGRWTVEGNQLCTIRKSESDGAETEACGTLPSGKAPGASWQTKDGKGAAITARIE